MVNLQSQDASVVGAKKLAKLQKLCVDNNPNDPNYPNDANNFNDLMTVMLDDTDVSSDLR